MFHSDTCRGPQAECSDDTEIGWRVSIQIVRSLPAIGDHASFQAFQEAIPIVARIFRPGCSEPTIHRLAVPYV
jgi:hypothetical protein